MPDVRPPRRTKDWRIHQPPMDKCSTPRVYRQYFEHHCLHCNTQHLADLLYDPAYYARIDPLVKHTKGLFKIHYHTRHNSTGVSNGWDYGSWTRVYAIEMPVKDKTGFWAPQFVVAEASLERAVQKAVATTEEVLVG